MTERSPYLPAVAASATGVLVGAGIVASRYALEQTSVASLALMRYAIGSLCLLPFALLNKRWRIDWSDFPAIAALGIGQFGLLVALLNMGLTKISAARAAVVFALLPILTAIVAGAFGRERLSLRNRVGVVLAFCGVALALRMRAPVGVAQETPWLGVLAVAASASVGAVCSVLYTPFLRRYDPVSVGIAAMLASVVVLLPLAFREGLFSTLPPLDQGGILAVLFIGASSALGYYLWLWALGRSTPTRVTVFLALSPLTAMVLGAALLGEAIALQAWAGIVFVAGGLWLASQNDPADAGR